MRVFNLLALFLCSMIIGMKAFAWGHMAPLRTGYKRSYLVFAAIQEGEIRYCLEVKSPVFSKQSLKLQVQLALSAWLKPVQEKGLVGKIRLRHMSCEEDRYQVRVLVHDEKENPGLGAYQLEEIVNGRYVSKVVIDTSYRWEGMPIIDTFELFGLDMLDSGSGLLSVPEAMGIEEYGTQAGLDWYGVFWSTYRVLLHELGHSFGLCDTIPQQIDIHCDKEFRSKQQPGSVMNNSLYMSLTDDDIAGIVSLFERLKDASNP